MAMPHDTLMAVSGLEIGMLGHKGCNLGFVSLGEQCSWPSRSTSVRGPEKLPG